MTTSAAAKKPCQGERRFHDVTVRWRCEHGSDSCHVAVRWLSDLIVETTLNAARRRQPFSVTSEADTRLAVEGEFHFHPGTGVLTLAWLRTPAGAWHDERLCPSHPEPPFPPAPPVPPEPPSPVPVEDEASEIVAGGGDLFPYVYLRDWPSLSAAALRDRFVTYTVTCGNGDTRLYCALAAIDRAAPDARQLMTAQALAFIDGRAPYTMQYAPVAAALIGPIARFSATSLALSRHPPHDQAQFQRTVEEMLGMGWQEILFYLGSEPFARELDRAWQNLFARIVVAGYDRVGADEMTRTVTLAALLLRVAIPFDATDTKEGEPPLMPLDPWTPQRLADGIAATVVLPSDVFPLPPRAPPTRDSGADADAAATVDGIAKTGRVLPYAIGDLRLVRRKLVGYEPGELAHIENVMAGERKTSSLRRRHVDEHERRDSDAHRERVAQDDGATASTLDQQASRVMRERYQLDYDTTYGPPTEAKQVGKIVLTPGGTDPSEQRDDTRDAFAREITTLAARRLAHDVQASRRHVTRHEHDEHVRHRFDRHDRDGHQRGIYRWLNAVYRCWVAPRGRRFVLELMLPRPAAGYIAAQRDLAGVTLAEPPSPAMLGLAAFTDISLDPADPRWYARLASLYGVDDVEPPPDAQVTLAAAFESGAPTTLQVMTVPAGYVATSATVALSAGDATLSAVGAIGASRFTALADGAAPTPIALAGQTGTLPLALNVIASAGAVTGEATSPWSLAIDVTCEAGAARIDRWKSLLYARLLAGYRDRRRAWLAAAGATPGGNDAPNRPAWRAIVREEIRRAGLRALVQLGIERTGERDRTARFLPALLMFLEQSLEWSAMSYSFLVDLDGDGHHHARRIAGEDEPLAAFLDASHARVLLPVSPGRERTVAYFMGSGSIWNGEDALAPTLATPIAGDGGTYATRWLDLVDDLKQAHAHGHHEPHAPPRPIDTWNVVVPTTLTWLEDGSALPRFD